VGFLASNRTVLQYRNMRYGEQYHPAMAWGRWIVLICLISMFIAAVTGIIPAALEPLFILVLFSGILFGAILSFSGYFKSVDRQAYPFMVVMICIAFTAVIIYALTRG